jgi:2-polyprenyl-3-methyl-5-hydroxy-6-metoxy-1,4-benzoquinol methylase
LLHTHLEKVAKSIIGIDIDDHAIEFLKEHGIKSIIKMDAENIQLTQKFDLIVAGDVIEHMSNPGLFLQQCTNLLNRDGIIVISVPNAFHLIGNVWAWITNRERVHKDHCYYFSPKTLAQLCSRYHFTPIALTFISGDSKYTKLRYFINNIRRFLVTFFPFTASGIIMEFKKDNEIINSDNFFELK